MRRFRRTVYAGEGIPGLLMFGRDARPGALPLREHRHAVVEICYVASGEVTWITGEGSRMQLVGGMLSVMPPGLRHRGELDLIAPSDLYWILLDPRRTAPAARKALAPLLTGGPFVAGAGAGFQALLDGAMEEMATRAPGWKAAVQARLSLVVVEALRLARGAQDAGHRAPPLPVACAARVLAENMESPPTIRDLARQVGMGPTRFHAIFRKAIGMTPRDYLGRLRLRAAKLALRETDEEITVLALRLGFPSSQYFSAVFRRHTGLTPRAFRRLR
jgi:AraC-like DNA-binding protein